MISRRFDRPLAVVEKPPSADPDVEVTRADVACRSARASWSSDIARRSGSRTREPRGRSPTARAACRRAGRPRPHRMAVRPLVWHLSKCTSTCASMRPGKPSNLGRRRSTRWRCGGSRSPSAWRRSCSPASPQPVPPMRLPLRVLFVGNSLTERNDLPGGVAGSPPPAGSEISTRRSPPAGWASRITGTADARAEIATGRGTW